MSADGFRERARQEAERYGDDPWVFVRELLQNARDAGARVVSFTVARSAGRDLVGCRDDGCGMSLEHARRYLFTLYASSKRGGRGAAGRFGVGFWSVLRFDPERITVRSRPSDGEGWEVVLDGALKAEAEGSCVMFGGTEVVLERTARGVDPLPLVVAAARRDARHLRLRDDGERLLEVTVNGRPITEELTLPAPSLRFRRPGLRGVVALGDEARVDVLAHGLRVRSAPFLDELLLAEEDAPPAVELAEGLLPRVVLDSDRLEVLLARGDLREGAALRRAVAVAHGELRRLVRSELDRSAPLRGPRRWLERTAELWRGSRTLAVVTATVVGAVLGVTLAFMVAGRVPGGPTPSAAVPVAGSPAPPPADPGLPVGYRDLGSAYSGPAVDTLDDRRAVDLRYRPAAAAPWFAAFHLTGVTGVGGAAAATVGPYRGAACAADCLEVELRLDAPPGPVRVPVATGQLVDPGSVLLDGQPVELLGTGSGDPVLVLAAASRGVLRYRSAPAPASGPATATSWPPLPEELVAVAQRLRGMPPGIRAETAQRVVASRIAYDRSAEVAARHRAAVAAGVPALERALAIGAGDCDVQNYVLAALVDASGLPSRLAVGFVGRDGRASEGVHAWTEYLDDARWWVADASVVPSAVRVVAETPSGSAAAESRRNGAGAALPAAPAPRRLPRQWILGAVMAALTSLGWLGSRLRRRGGRAAAGDAAPGSDGLAPLLRAALLRPRAWRRVEAVYGRPLVPTWGRGALSLRRALALVRRGRLFRATSESAIVGRARRRRAAVIDARSQEGRVVADLLGARDLDRWQGVLEGASRSEAVGRVETALARVGLHVRLCVVDGAAATPEVIEGHPFGLRRGSMLVALDAGGRPWSMAAAAVADRPEWAALVLGDEILARSPEPERRRARLLGELARRALAGVPA